MINSGAALADKSSNNSGHQIDIDAVQRRIIQQARAHSGSFGWTGGPPDAGLVGISCGLAPLQVAWLGRTG